MKRHVPIFLLVGLLCFAGGANAQAQKISFDFYGDSVAFEYAFKTKPAFTDTLSPQTIEAFYEEIVEQQQKPAVDAIIAYKKAYDPDDWVFYQLVRRTAEAICPKAENYYLYTLVKCYLLRESGYDVALNITGDKLLFYIQSDEDIYDVPTFKSEGKTYVCLNYHDYGFNIDLVHAKLLRVNVSGPGAHRTFSYKLTKLPDFSPGYYRQKILAFSYEGVDYDFRIKVNDAVKTMFVNYPVADYNLYFNVPLSRETYNTLIPQLKKSMRGMGVNKGIDYLMHFTRLAFSYEPDEQHFGREKHLSPEQTLLYDRSDCEDRAALFYCLVKAIYNRPMIVLEFPHHLAVAVNLDKPVGKQIRYNGMPYSVCEPTPQADDLPVGSLSPEMGAAAYQVAYAYTPAPF